MQVYLDANAIETHCGATGAHLTCHRKKYVLGALAAKCFGWPFKNTKTTRETDMQNIQVAQVVAAGLSCFMALSVLADGAKSTAGQSDSTLTKSAEGAAPRSVSGKATVIAMDADGKMRTIRKGTNGWTCMPDNPTTPGPDPMCWDKNAGEWVDAWMAHKTPPAKVGLMYMLAGGTDASNTDPYAQKPTTENHWIQTGPHIMIVGADDSFYSTYPKSTDPDTKVPYVMWAGTPYQHLMAPVK
jgi:hypothetical protein